MIAIDSYAYNNKLRSVHPAEKSLFALLTMGICLTSQTMITPWIVFLLMSGGIIIIAGIPARVLLKLLVIPLSFLIISVLTIAFSISADSTGFWAAQTIGGVTIGIRYADLLIAASLLIRSLGAVVCLYFLALTTPITELISVLHKIKVPFIITELMILIYRFIFVFMETAITIRRAQYSRSGYVSLRSSYRSMSRLFSALLGKVFFKSQDLYNTMAARGYNGEIRVLTKQWPVSHKNYFIIAGIELPLILMNLLWR